MFYESRSYRLHLFSFFNLKTFQTEMKHPISANYSEKIKLSARERAVSSKKVEVVRDVYDKEILESVWGLVQTYFDKTAPSLRRSPLVAYPVHGLMAEAERKSKKACKPPRTHFVMRWLGWKCGDGKRRTGH